MNAPSASRVLVLEPESDIREVITEILEDEGYLVVACRDLASSRTALETQDVELVLADSSIGSAHSPEALNELRKVAGAVPMGVMSTLLSSGPSLAKAGFDFVLMKPFSTEDLIAAVAERVRVATFPEAQRQAVATYFAALSAGKFDALRDICTKDVRYLLPGEVRSLSTEVTGCDAFVAYAREVFGRFVAAAFEVEAVLPLPEGAVARYRGAWGPEGQRQSLPGAVVFHFRGEEISQVGVRLNLSALGRVAP